LRLPVRVVELIHRMRRVEDQLAQELERDPRPEEVAAVLSLPRERVTALQGLLDPPVPLDVLEVDDEECSPPSELPTYCHTDTPTEAEITRAALLNGAISVLTLPEREVIGRRYRVCEEREKQQTPPVERPHEASDDSPPEEEFFDTLNDRRIRYWEHSALQKLRTALESEAALCF
jgi:DNA-directed RNA polymerase sigma subunit (sigma70/sigma32)